MADRPFMSAMQSFRHQISVVPCHETSAASTHRQATQTSSHVLLNRAVGVKRFQTIRTSVLMSLAGRAFFGIGTQGPSSLILVQTKLPPRLR